MLALGFVNDKKTAQADNVFVISAADTYPFQLTQKAGEWMRARRQWRLKAGGTLSDLHIFHALAGDRLTFQITVSLPGSLASRAHC